MISGTHLHAMAIHFPIALLCIGFLSAVISLFFRRDFFSQAAFYLLVLGALGSIAAYLSGNAAGEGIEEGALGKAVELHEQAATISLWRLMNQSLRGVKELPLIGSSPLMTGGRMVSRGSPSGVKRARPNCQAFPGSGFSVVIRM